MNTNYLKKLFISSFYNNMKYRKYNSSFSVSNLIEEFQQYEKDIQLPEYIPNLEYLLDDKNKENIINNVKERKTHFDKTNGDIKIFFQLISKYKENTQDESIKQKLIEFSLKLPNTTHVKTSRNEDYHIIQHSNDKKTYNFKPKSFLNLTSKSGLCRIENISHYLGNRSYYFIGDLCLLESAIIQYVLNKLIDMKFQLITVSDILNEKIIQTAMNTSGERSQVYHLEPDAYGPRWCLSGTAELGIAKYLVNRTIPSSQLPLKLAAISRCYRAEISDTGDEKGVYRVHCFTKIEMFGVTRPEESEQSLEELLNIEQNIFSNFGLHTRTLDMGIHELGSQAHRKFDIEAWMSGSKKWGELSSCSDCTDYQSRRLNIKSEDGRYVHTINGTAAAIPRLLIAIVETFQNKDGTISIPECLQKYMFNRKVIGDRKSVPTLHKIKAGLSKAKMKELAKAALSK